MRGRTPCGKLDGISPTARSALAVARRELWHSLHDVPPALGQSIDQTLAATSEDARSRSRLAVNPRPWRARQATVAAMEHIASTAA